MELSELGGKSTHANAIAIKQKLRLIYLDQLHHPPNSNWQVRPEAEFLQLHDTVIGTDRWVIDGNYSKCMPQRFRRATGVILLDAPAYASLFRYLRRSLFERDRLGALEVGRDSVKWKMVHHIVVVSPKNRKRYAAMYREIERTQAVPAIDVGSQPLLSAMGVGTKQQSLR